MRDAKDILQYIENLQREKEIYIAYNLGGEDELNILEDVKLFILSSPTKCSANKKQK